jgi:hypothetical protein
VAVLTRSKISFLGCVYWVIVRAEHLPDMEFIMDYSRVAPTPLGPFLGADRVYTRVELDGDDDDDGDT